MSVTAASGFLAAGVACGLKSTGKKDLALVQNRGPLKNVASVFTSNRCKANPVLWSQQVMADGIADAIVLNSGGANCYTGARGFQTTHATAEAVAERLGVSAGDVLVCSTGLIGEQLDLDKLKTGVWDAGLEILTGGASSEQSGLDAAHAIMTTDVVPKLSVRTVSATATATATATAVATGSAATDAAYTIGGMAKGAGMLAPGLATMLVVITTDAMLSSAQLDSALRHATRVTFDRLDSDGCMSTNDTVSLMASGASGYEPSVEDFTIELTALCQDLALQLQADAEGSSHDIAITVTGAISEDEAVEVARAVARSNLFKAAMFGNDPNWGRVLAAVGTTQATFDPYNVDVAFNGVKLCIAGEPGESRDLVDLSPRAVDVVIDIKAGPATATIWTNDLTHDYVHENSAYAS